MDGQRSRRTGTALAVGAALLVAGAPAAAAERVSTTRLAGPDRWATAVEVARERGTTVDTVLLARGDDFPDALAGAGLAGGLDAPVLLTRPDALPEATSAALQELSVRRVVLLGGPSAISTAVAADLARDHEVLRVDGADRWSTSAAAARLLVEQVGALGSVAGRTTVLVASGEAFPDALAGGAVAAAAGLPVLLTAADALPTATAEVLAELAPEQVLLLGGETAVSPAVEQELGAHAGVVRRVSGINRQGTAAALADLALREGVLSGATAVLVRGDGFADALTGAPEAGRVGAPVLLTVTPSTLGARSRTWFLDRSDTLTTVRAVGGPGAVADAVLAEAAQAATTEPPEDEPFPADRAPDSEPASGDARLNLADVRVAQRDGFDRVVLELTGTGTPGWRVDYVDVPRAQGSGAEVDVSGEAFLRVDLDGMASPTGSGGQDYTGPSEVLVDDPLALVEVDVGGLFEGHRQVHLGLTAEQPFRVLLLQSPTRLVVDVQHP